MLRCGLTLLDSLRGLSRELEPGCVDEYWRALITGREAAQILGISGGRWRQICLGTGKDQESEKVHTLRS